MTTTGGSLNPAAGFIYSLFQYANVKFRPPDDSNGINPWSLEDMGFTVSLKSIWIYTLGPLVGGLLAGLFHWRLTSMMKKFKLDRSVKMSVVLEDLTQQSEDHQIDDYQQSMGRSVTGKQEGSSVLYRDTQLFS